MVVNMSPSDAIGPPWPPCPTCWGSARSSQGTPEAPRAGAASPTRTRTSSGRPSGGCPGLYTPTVSSTRSTGAKHPPATARDRQRGGRRGHALPRPRHRRPRARIAAAPPPARPRVPRRGRHGDTARPWTDLPIATRLRGRPRRCGPRVQEGPRASSRPFGRLTLYRSVREHVSRGAEAHELLFGTE